MRFIFFSFLAFSLAVAPVVSVADEASDKADAAGCKQHLEKIYGAIQAYRKDQKKLPGLFNELVPKYLSDKEMFLCPKGKRENAEHPYPHLADPEITSHYIYEFSNREMGDMWNGGSLTMGDWKSLEMMLIGGGVPIIRCFMHTPVLNISFDGKIFDSPPTWEELYTDRVSIENLAPGRLRARVMKMFGNLQPDEAAFEEVEAAAELNAGPFVGDSLTDEQKEMNAQTAAKALQAASKAGDFLEKYPDHAKADDARALQRRMLFTAARTGDEEGMRRLKEMATASEVDISLPEGHRFELAAMALYAINPPGKPGFEEGARRLMEKFPENPQPYLMLLTSLEEGSDKHKKLAEEIAANEDAPEQARTVARGALKKLNLKGSSIEMTFTALDGREVDLSDMKGKVVLVDFWATWCGPCVAELPNLKATYDKLHDKGFEIVGISFDTSKEALEKFVKEKDMEWPQYFDGKGWQNKFGQEYGINAIPTMWLVGRDGKVASVNARGDLERKVEALLGPNVAQ